ncbi:MAG TPA: hypothetical protein VGE25_09785 [Sediminibacterium sp.]|nr:hypothetical protein [Bacteroidota bacterium]
MRNRLWYELTQAKHNETYICLIVAQQRRLLNFFNVIITVFSSAGVMGWKMWDKLPVIACIIIALISLGKLIQPHVLPSEKQIEKLDKANDFYFNFYLKLEEIWFDHECERLTDYEMQRKFHNLKQTEREVNLELNQIHKKINRNIEKMTKLECDKFFLKAFNTPN